VWNLLTEKEQQWGKMCAFEVRIKKQIPYKRFLMSSTNIGEYKEREIVFISKEQHVWLVVMLLCIRL
jgi:hypothetical protein